MKFKSTCKASKKTIFLTIFAISAAVLSAEFALLGLSRAFEKSKRFAQDYLAEKAGISISFSHLSPSIFARFRAENFSACDISSGKRLIFVDSLGIDYDLPKIFSKSGAEGLKEIAVREVYLRCSAEEIAEFAERLAKRSDKGDIPSEESEKLRNFSLKLFERLSIQKIVLEFEDNRVKAVAEIEGASLSSQAIGGDLNFVADARLRAKTKGAKEFGVSADISVSGQAKNDFSDFRLETRFDSLNAASASLRDITLLTNFSNGEISASTVKNAKPYDFSALYNFADKDLNVSFFSEKFGLQDFFNANSGKSGKSAVSLSGKYSFHANFLQKAVFDYFAQGEVVASTRNSPVSVSFDISGDDQTISVNELSVGLPNGNKIEGVEVYASILSDGAAFYCPQIALGEQMVSNIQAQIEKNAASGNFEFEFSLNDFSHGGGGFAKEIVVEGTVLRENLFVQMSVSLNQFFADSIFRAASFFAPEDVGERLATASELAKPYVVSETIYLSAPLADSPLENLSVFAPAGIVVSVESETDNAVFSLSGNAERMQISKMDVSLAGQDFSLSGDISFAQSFSDVRADLQLSLNSILYSLSANYVAGQSVSVYGDYGLYATFGFSDPNLKTAALQMSNFPIRVGRFSGEIASEIYFSFPREEPFEAVISDFTLTANSIAAGSHPRLQIEGEARNSEFFCTMQFSDSSSQMSGTGSASWRGNFGALSSVFAQFSMRDAAGTEGISASFLTDGGGRLLSRRSEMTGSLNLAGIRMKHFLPAQTDENLLRCSLGIAGTFSEPEFSLEVAQADFVFGKSSHVFASGKADWQSGLIALESFDVALKSKYLDQRLENVSASFFPGDLTGVLSADYRGVFEKSDFLDSRVKVSFSARKNLANRGENAIAIFKAFDRISAKINFEKFSGNFFEEKPATSVDFLAQNGQIQLSGGYDDSIFALFDSKSGILTANFAAPFPVSFSAAGTILNNSLDVAVDDIKINLSPFCHIISFPFIRVNSAVVEGQAHIGGALSEPEFSGELFARETSLSIPLFVGESLYSKQFYAFLDGNALKIEKATFSGKKALASLDLTLLFDGWKFESVALNVATLEGKTVAAKCDLQWLQAEGEGGCDIAIFATKSAVDVSGTIRVSNAVAALNPAAPPSEPLSTIATTANLKIEIGSRVQAMFPSLSNPVIRGAVAPNTPMKLFVDTAAGEYEFEGDFDLRGGEIVYVSRNFMLKQGHVSVNADQNYMDPLITVVAEMRERDFDGKPVTITLSAVNQRFSALSPTFSASPAKTEGEINRILGRILISENVNSETRSQWNDIIAAAADYGAQMLVFREIESRLRNSLNLDLFSMRIPVVQNAIAELLNRNSENTPVSFAKIFDDSTIYLGKYFGEKSNIYANLSLTLESDSAIDRLNFVPAAGFELLLPWNLTAGFSIAKEFDDEKINFGEIPQYASFSLSWKKSF